MKRHLNKIERVVAIAGLFLASCSGDEFPDRSDPRGGSRSSDEANLAEQPLVMVSALELDGKEFRINGLRAGEQSFMDSKSPELTYLMPEKADYTQILRCKSDTIIQGTFDTINDVDLENASLEEEIKIFQRNDFWKSALAQENQCVLIAEGFSGKVYLDNDADSGSYHYLMRACVNPSRISDASGGIIRNCSRQVAFSPLVSDFKNYRVEAEKQAISRVQLFQDKVDGLGREIHYLALDLNNALAKCQKEEEDRQVRVKFKQNLATILGAGISLGMQIALPETGIQAVQSGAKTWTTLWKETWEARDVIAGNGKQLAGLLLYLTTSAKDFPRSCTSAKEIAMKSNIKTMELKTQHRELAQALDDAEVARKARLEVEAAP